MSLRRRRILQWITFRIRHPLAFVMSRLMFAAEVREGLIDYHDGVALVDGTLHGRYRDLFIVSVNEALALIREVDPRRYRMVRRNLTAIIADELVGAMGQYDPFCGSCAVDLEAQELQWGGEWHRWAIAKLAARIVHEATHGRLFHAGIGYGEQTRAFVERLCTYQARAFSAHLCAQRPQFTHLVEPAYHARRWDWAWHAGLWARLRRGLYRLRLANRR